MAISRLNPVSSIPPLERKQADASTVITVAFESRAKGGVLVGQIQNRLRQARGLDNASDFYGTFILDESSNGVDQVGRELP
jgi:hypothetical protein